MAKHKVEKNTTEPAAVEEGAAVAGDSVPEEKPEAVEGAAAVAGDSVPKEEPSQEDAAASARASRIARVEELKARMRSPRSRSGKKAAQPSAPAGAARMKRVAPVNRAIAKRESARQKREAVSRAFAR